MVAPSRRNDRSNILTNVILCRDTDMNYVSAVYSVVVTIIVVDWFVRGKRGYRGQTVRREEVEARLTDKEFVR